jgi:hypothetical protein
MTALPQGRQRDGALAAKSCLAIAILHRVAQAPRHSDEGFTMDKMEWALWALEYLRDARAAIHEDFTAAMGELRGYQNAHRESWYSSCKSIIPSLYHYSSEFVADTTIPSSDYPSPEAFETRLSEYRLFVAAMRDELEDESRKYQELHKVDGPPFLVAVALRQVTYLLGAVEYVERKRPEAPATPEAGDMELIVKLARRFHESVLSLATHPHGGQVLKIADEWDCQYLFRSILAGLFVDIREEEWNPSVAGSSARCEFFLKTLRLMIELKYVRKAGDAAKIKGELAKDLVDYGGNPLVAHVIVLVYDPAHALKNPVAFQADLSGSTKGLETVQVVVSPPRDT